MAKAYKVVDPLQPGTSTQGLETDWSKCVLCQEDTSEMLHCPAESTRATQGAGYKTIAELLVGFDRIGCLPTSINLSRLDDGNGIEETLQRHKAKWHDSCRLLYNRTKLQCTEKRKKPPEDAADDSADSSKKFTRKSAGKKSASAETCFFCDKPAPEGESLTRKASTFGLDINVRKAAMKLQDKSLLAKLSAGDLIAQEARYHLPCLLSLYNRARETKTYVESGVDKMNHGLAFAELGCEHSEERHVQDEKPVWWFLEPNSQEDFVPVSLLALVAMVLNGPNIKAQSSSSTMPQPVLTISQLLMSNSMVRRRENQQAPCTTRHNQGRKTPLPIYLGVMVHTKTRKRELVDRLYYLGLSISYYRVLAISTELGDKICHY
ncbi:hypothetical protein GWK47_010917 [Chionoecetes opilio]|uniref:Uncharacterized protein n=1 Tax=Chionoecetes opilio TaxID=41210 RepID=A0A8J4Y6N3_CHIOP|nr:hypothetical protein GWK47_010917 [Chionoecetes opilio]